MCGTIAIGVFYVIDADAKLAAGQQLIAQLAASRLSGKKSHNKYAHKQRVGSTYVSKNPKNAGRTMQRIYGNRTENKWMRRFTWVSSCGGEGDRSFRPVAKSKKVNDCDFYG
jgi:hypothetical protein